MADGDRREKETRDNDLNTSKVNCQKYDEELLPSFANPVGDERIFGNNDKPKESHNVDNGPITNTGNNFESSLLRSIRLIFTQDFGSFAENDSQETNNRPFSTDQNSSSEIKRYKPDDIIKNYRNHLTEQELIEIHHASSVYYFGEGVPKQNSSNEAMGYYVIIPNDQLAFRYEILRKISYGSYATVVQAFDHKTRREIAIKIFREGASFDKCAVQECAMLSYVQQDGDVSTKHIVIFYDWFSFRFHACLTFELMENDLSYFIKSNRGGIKGKLLKKIIKSILSGLKFLHDKTIIHGDLKPNNIALSFEGGFKCKILDLGLSMFTAECSNHPVAQALCYRAPEVLLRLPYNCKIDIFSLGCIVGEMVTGWKLFVAQSELVQMYNYVEVLGFPPRYLLDSSEIKESFFMIYSSGLYLHYMPGFRHFEANSKTLENVLYVWNDLHLIDFVESCLNMDPKKRTSARGLLSHPMLQ